MTEKAHAQASVPVLTDVVESDASTTSTHGPETLDNASLIAELQTQLAASAFELTEEVLHSAFAEMEATLFEQVSRRLRQELPELIDRVLREHLTQDPDEA